MIDKENIEESMTVFENQDAEFEKVLQIVEQSDELTDQGLSRLLADDVCLDDAMDLWAVKKAVEKANVPLPDVDAEWDYIQSRLTITHKPIFIHYYKYIVAAAAILILAFVFTWNRQKDVSEDFEGKYVVYQANDEARDIIIQTDKGNRVVFNKQNVSKLGSEVSQIDELAIAYHQMNTNIVESHTLTIPEGKNFRIVLSDGSEVWLNAGSRLIYPTQFIGDNRVVQLDGEAYFKVQSDASHPFIVKSGDIFTKVLGTEFNIRMRDSSSQSMDRSNPNSCEITLVKGKISVCGPEKDQMVTLSPGMQAVFDKESSVFNIKEVDTDLYSYWKEGYFFFDNERLEDMMKQIGSWYNVNVVFRNPNHCNVRMHFFCERNSNISAIVEQLNMLQKVHASVNNNTILID